MSNHENEIKKHLEDLKKYEHDLFDDEEDLQGYFTPEASLQKTDSKKKLAIWKRLLISILAFSMLVMTIGTLLSVLNIPAYQFIKKSQELEKSESIQIYKEAIVTVQADNRKGTGFAISPDGMIVTNAHVVENAKNGMISFANGDVYQATVQKTYPEKDVAFLAISTDKAIPALELANSGDWQVNDHVVIIGNPLSFNFIANEGTIIGLSEVTGIDSPALLLAAPVYKGNSGSPVIATNGKVIGIVYAKGTVHVNSKKEKVGFAIPIDHFPIDDVFEELP